MTFELRNLSLDALRTKLARTLGFADYPRNQTSAPYLNYIENRYIGRGTLEEYIVLFIMVVKYLQDAPVRNDALEGERTRTIRGLLDKLCDANESLFADTQENTRMRKDEVEDTALYILGVWSSMLSSFVHLPNGSRRILNAYKSRNESIGLEVDVLSCSLSGLLHGSGLLPTPGDWTDVQDDRDRDILDAAKRLMSLLSGEKTTFDNGTSPRNIDSSPMRRSFFGRLPSSTSDAENSSSYIAYRTLDNIDAVESLSIKAKRLNAFTLKVLGAVEICWTHNISRHLLLSQRRGRSILELFALPCVFTSTSIFSKAVGISSDFAQEIQESYCILFNAWPETPLHVKLGYVFGWRKICWCWACSSYRHRIHALENLKTISAAQLSTLKARRLHGQGQGQAVKDEFDPRLIKLMENPDPPDWTQELFPSLWPRIVALEEHLQRARPWSIWILFRDRRDTLQFWTFL
jgi:hypothetical protein